MSFQDSLKAFFKAIGDFFLDKQGGSDEKRLIGIIFLLGALIYAFANKPGPDVWTTAGGMAGIGVTLLTVAGAQDGIAPKQTPPANPTQGQLG